MRHHLCGMLVLVFGLCGGAELQAADSPEKQAETLLQQAQTACEAGRDPEAEKLFRTVLEKFAQTPSAQSARFGFGWVLTRSSTARLPQAIENLTPPANDGNFPQRGWALYLLAVCHRREALAELDKPAANPTAWEQQKKAAEPKLQEALRRFHEARDWFAAKQQDGWSGRARCDEAEILLRLNRHRDVRSVCEPFAKDEKFTTNPHRAMGLYYHGFACFLDGGYDEASQSLHQVAPFDQPGFGLHAEYLVGRLLHRADENEAASVHYEAVLTGFQKQRTAALAARKEPPFQNLPAAEQARLTALATHAPPDYVAAAALHLARLKQESGRYAEALGLFESWCADYPQSPLMPDAMLHRGACLVQGERDADAEKLLEPLLTSTPRLADQAQFWLSLARFHLACLIDTTRKSERDGKINAALEALRQSADRANQLTATDPEAKPRRHEMLFCYADALEKAERFRDAGQTFEQLWNEQAMPARRDLILQRMVVAYGRANDNRSEPRGEEFFREFRDSVFLPIVSYRLAANAWNRAQEIAVRHDRNQTEELEKRLHEAADKFAAVATKFPESVPANQARLAAGICQALVDQFDRANTILSQISAADRSGELAVADYLQGDCLIQMSPREPVDRAEMMQARDHLTHAEQLLTRFHNSARASPYQAAAWLALGECRARLAALTTDATRRATDREAARSAWEQLLRIAPQDRLAGYAEIALAKLRAVQGDRAGAIQELRLYQNGAKQSHFVAPLAVMQLAVQLQEEGEIAESEKILANARTQWEGVLAKDPERIDWVHLLRFHHALALRGLSRGNEARPLFDRVYS
ncbi:MAG: hypothetical protein LC104_08900, partial [Bacteroidales bacterium]|nr:hypothetical protein [Bacteroidales bacterium]